MANEYPKTACDKDGEAYLVDDEGKPICDENGNRLRPARKTSKPGEFTTYDTSHGHCGLCGSLTCNGSCFK